MPSYPAYEMRRQQQCTANQQCPSRIAGNIPEDPITLSTRGVVLHDLTQDIPKRPLGLVAELVHLIDSDLDLKHLPTVTQPVYSLPTPSHPNPTDLHTAGGGGALEVPTQLPQLCWEPFVLLALRIIADQTALESPDTRPATAVSSPSGDLPGADVQVAIAVSSPSGELPCLGVASSVLSSSGDQSSCEGSAAVSSPPGDLPCQDGNASILRPSGTLPLSLMAVAESSPSGDLPRSSATAVVSLPSDAAAEVSSLSGDLSCPKSTVFDSLPCRTRPEKDLEPTISASSDQDLPLRQRTYLAITRGETPEVDETLLEEEQSLFARTDLDQFDTFLDLYRLRQKDGDICDERALAVLNSIIHSREQDTDPVHRSQLGTSDLLNGPAYCQLFGLTRDSFSSQPNEGDSSWESRLAVWIDGQFKTKCPGLLVPDSIRVKVAPRLPNSPDPACLQKQQPRSTGPDKRDVKVTLRLNDCPDRVKILADVLNPFSETNCSAQRIFVRPIAEGKRGEVALSSDDSRLLLALGRSLRLSNAELERLLADGAFHQLHCCIGPVLVRIGPAERPGSDTPDLRVFIQGDGLTMLHCPPTQSDLCLRLGNSVERPVTLHLELPPFDQETLRRLTNFHVQAASESDRAFGNCLVVGPFREDISSSDEEALQLGLQKAIPTGTVQLLKSPGHAPHGFLCEFESADAANLAKRNMINQGGKSGNQLLNTLQRFDIRKLPTVTRINLPPILCNLITKDHFFAINRSRNNTQHTKSGSTVSSCNLPKSLGKAVATPA